ncbi:MAG: phosphatase PAP2 family protein [Neobacillus sp.]
MQTKVLKYYTLGFIILSLFAAAYTTINVVTERDLRLDEIGAVFFGYVPDTLNPFFIVLTELGDKKGIGLVAVFVLGWLLLIRRNFLGAAILTLAAALGNEVNKLIKNSIARERPDLEHLAFIDSYSFPSGHAMVGLIVYFFVAYLIVEDLESKLGKIIVISFTGVLLFLIGASRIILQVHYASDVIGGFAFGYIWVLLWVFMYEYMKKKFR